MNETPEHRDREERQRINQSANTMTPTRRPRRYCSHTDSKWNGINRRDGVDYCGTCGKPVRPEWQPSDAARIALAESLAR